MESATYVREGKMLGVIKSGAFSGAATRKHAASIVAVVMVCGSALAVAVPAEAAIGGPRPGLRVSGVAHPGAVQESGATPDTFQSGSTCYYNPPDWSYAAASSGQYAANPANAYNDYGEASISDSSILPGSNSGWAESQIGWAIGMPSNWPAGTYVTNNNVWNYNGSLATSTDFNAYGGTSSASAGMVYRIAEVSGPVLYDLNPATSWTNLDQQSINNNTGLPQQFNISNSGNYEEAFNTVSNQYYLVATDLYLNVSDGTTYLTNASATSNFSDQYGYGAYDGANSVWVYHLPSGWTLSSCGG
jgi:hypothetical protein